ncbi:MAG: M28 family peptidase [Gemmatimonadales bacterium]
MRIALLALLSVPTLLAAQPAPASSGPADRHLALVRARFSGDRALETVALMDRYVRWPGNAGFDSSIANVARRLAAAGYVEASVAKPPDRLTYRVERYPLPNAAWEPLDASLVIVGADGKTTPVLAFATNKNMLASNSFSTSASGVEAELVRVSGATAAALDAANVRGKIVMTDGALGGLFTQAVVSRGAVGAIAYGMPAYTQPEKNRNSIQFTNIPYDSAKKGWGIRLSYAAREKLNAALAAGPVKVRVMTRSRFVQPAVELAVVAEIRGSQKPDERFVYSAHIQEPGANDDASGVGTEVEMARVAAELVKGGQEDPKRTMTFLWGQENRVTARYIQQDSVRAKGIRWGISMDMTGEDTKKTGGTFLIEKMPDPSAIWTRGEDHHTEWGAPRPLGEDRMMPHYFNDYLFQRCLDQAKGTGWVVKTNPFEGGSDHVSYLNAKVPGVLFWHFTDQFYHTDGDRIEMVDPNEMKNTGIASLISGLTIASADGGTARAVVAEVERAAMARLEAERKLSADTLTKGGAVAYESHILETWGLWYRNALKTAEDIEVGGASAATKAAIAAAVDHVQAATAKAIAALKGNGE